MWGSVQLTSAVAAVRGAAERVGLGRNDYWEAFGPADVGAERHSPGEVRHSALARELVRVCLGRERRSRTPGLRGLAERLGVLG